MSDDGGLGYPDPCTLVIVRGTSDNTYHSNNGKNTANTHTTNNIAKIVVTIRIVALSVIIVIATKSCTATEEIVVVKTIVNIVVLTIVTLIKNKSSGAIPAAFDLLLGRGYRPRGLAGYITPRPLIT